MTELTPLKFPTYIDKGSYHKTNMPGRTKKDEAPAEDAAMEDAPPSAQPEEGNDEDVEEEDEEEVEPQRVKIVSRMS